MKKSNNLTKKQVVFVIFGSVFVISALIIFIIETFSNGIIHRKSIFQRNKLEVNSYNVYAVSFDDFNNLEDAETYSEIIKSQGGAGYVYQSGEFYVFGFIYPNLVYAKEIQDNLIRLGFDSKIKNIKIDELKIDYQGNDNQICAYCIDFFKNCYLSLYEEIIQIDEKNISELEVNKFLSEKTTKIIKFKEEISKVKQDYKIKEIILKYLVKIQDRIQNNMINKLNLLDFTSSLKCLCFDIILDNKDMIKELNNL